MHLHRDTCAPMMQTSLDSSFSAKRYEPCFWDVRTPVADTDTDRTSLIVDRLLWKRTFNDMIYEVKCDDLTINAHGCPNLIAGDTVTIRRSSEVPLEYHTWQCKLKNLTKADESGGSGGQGMWTLEVMHQSSQVDIVLHSKNFIKKHLPPDDFFSLQDNTWIGSSVLDVFLHFMSRSMGWGFGKMPPKQKSSGTHKNIWIANSFLFRKVGLDKMGLAWMHVGNEKPEVGQEIRNQSLSDLLQERLQNRETPNGCLTITQSEWQQKFRSVQLTLHSYIHSGNNFFKPDPSALMARLPSTPCTGVTGDVQPNKFKLPAGSRASDHDEHNRTEATRIFKEHALSVTHAIILTNPSNLHWRYGIVDFVENIITLDDPFGSEPDPHKIVSNAEILDTLRRLEYVAAGIRAAQGKQEVTFRFRVRVETTQRDGFQCGAHAVANILLFGGDQDNFRATTAVAQDTRLWMSLLIWLHSAKELVKEGGYLHNKVRDNMTKTTRPIEEALKSCQAKQEQAAKSIEKMAPATKAASSKGTKEIAPETSERIGGKRAVSRVQQFKFSEFETKKQARSDGGGFQSADRHSSPPPRPLSIDGVMKYEVEKVVEEDEAGSTVKVRWKGYSAHDDTWEPISAINPTFVDEFRQSQMIETRQGMQRRHVHDKPGDIYSYGGVDVLIFEGDDEFVIDGIREYARDVVRGLKERFPSASGTVLSAFDIFSLEILPSDQDSWNQERESYGEQDLSTLVNHYFPATGDIRDECKRTRVHAQWRTLRERMWEFKLKLTADARNSTSNFWADFLNTAPPTPCEDLRELVEIFLVIVLSSVPCERSYSAMNATKSKERSRMLTDLLNDLMTIKLNGPTIEGVGDDVVKDLIDKAFKEWHSRKKRCPARSHTDERPEKRKPEKDIMQAISMPRGERISKTSKKEQLEDKSKECQKNDSMSEDD